MARRYQSSEKDAETVASLPAATLGKLIEFFLNDCRLNQQSPQTIEGRAGRLKRLVWWSENVSKSPRLGESEVRDFLAYLLSGHEEKGGRWNDSPRHPSAVRPMGTGTYKTYYATLRCFLNWCVKAGEISSSPLAEIPRPKHQQEQVHPFTDEQLAALGAAAKRTTNPVRDYAIFCILLDTGIREMELCNLTIGDYDGVSWQICIRRGKGGKFRTVPIGQEAKRAVNAYLLLRSRARETAPELPLFVTEKGERVGKAMRRLALLRTVYRWGEAAKISRARCSPHTFRHSFAIRFLQNGGNVFALQRMLGHSSLTITQRYLDLAEGDIKAQHAQFSPLESLKKKGRT